MANQEKVRLMTRAEWYRQQEERGALRVNQYNNGAYVSMQIVKALIIATAGVAVAVLIWVFYEGENLLAFNDFEVILDIAVQIAVMYGAVLVITALVSWKTYTRIYTKARSSVKRYYTLLRRINSCNEKEKRRLTGQLPPVRKEGDQQ